MARFRNTFTTLILALTGLALSIPAHSVFAQGTTKTVAVTGQQAGGTPAGVNFNFFSSAVLNDTGLWRDTALNAPITHVLMLTGRSSKISNNILLSQRNPGFTHPGHGESTCLPASIIATLHHS